MHDPVRTVNRKVWRDGSASESARVIPEETALALTYNGGTYAVMMGTPQDLEDFAIGFSLSEGIIQSPDDIDSLDIVDLDDGIELRMWLAPIQSGSAERAAAAYRGPHRLRHLRHRFHRRSRSAGRDRRTGRIVLAAADHRGDPEHPAAASDQRRDARGACRGVLDAGARHRRAARGCRPSQRARQARRRAGAARRSPPATAWFC